MAKKVLSIYFILLSFVVAAQVPSFLWAKQFKGNTFDIGYGIKSDAAGNAYTTGRFDGTVDFDPNAGVYNLTTFGSYDICVSKLDPLGNFLWAKQMGGSGFDEGHSIFVDNIGNVYITGAFNGIADFDPGVGVFNLVSVGGSDIFVCKFDPSGNFIWAKSMGGASNDQAYSVYVNLSGNVFTTGTFGGIADFDPSATVFSLTSASGDAFISELDGTGNFVMAKSFNNSGGAGSTFGNSIRIDGAGNIYVTGNFSGVTDFDPSASFFNLTETGSGDIFIVKLNSIGSFIWAKQYSGNPLFDRGYSFAIDGLGDVIVTGFFSGTVDFNPGAGVFNLTTGGGDDSFISKLDASGNFLWAKQIANLGSSYGTSVAVDLFNNIYTTGLFVGTADFDPGVGVNNLTAFANDVYISKLDPLGNFNWAGQILGSSASSYGIGYSIDVDASANVYVTGRATGTNDFDPHAGVFNLTTTGSAEIFVLKLATICPSVTLALIGQHDVLCKGNATGSATISASGGTSFTYSWNPSVGTASAVAGLSAGVYTCNVENACGNTSTISVTINEPPIAVSLTATANNTLVCIGSPSTLTAIGIGTGIINYTWMPSSLGSTSIVSPTASTIYSVTISDANGCMLTQTVNINTNPTPIISVSNATICLGETYTFTPLGATSYTYLSGSNIITPTITSTYSISGSNTFGCVTSTVVTVYVVNNPTVSISSSSICSGSMYTLTPTGALSYTYSSGSNIINPLTNTTYTITGVNAFGCEHTTTVSITVLPSPTLTAISDVTITPGDQTSLTAISNATGYVWSPSTNLSCNTCSTTIASPTESTRYCVIGSLGSCTVETCVDVVLDESCKSNINKTVPTAFSPNGDGVNDMYCLQGWDLCVNSFYIAVYDRWGERVYESTDTNFCWDGYYKGKLLLPAVFVYYIKAEGLNIGTVNKKGNITLLK